MTLSVSERTELRELAKKATPGPWFLHDFADPAVSSNPSPADVTVSCDHPATITVCMMGNAMTASLVEARTNAAYIAAAHPLKVQALLDALDAAEAVAETLVSGRELLAAWMMRNSYATGHGDTVADLVAELEPQHKDRLDAADLKVATLEQALSEARKNQRTPGMVESCGMGQEFCCMGFGPNGTCDHPECPLKPTTSSGSL